MGALATLGWVQQWSKPLDDMAARAGGIDRPDPMFIGGAADQPDRSYRSCWNLTGRNPHAGNPVDTKLDQSISTACYHVAVSDYFVSFFDFKKFKKNSKKNSGIRSIK